MDELKQEQSKSRQHFSAELEKGRAAIDEYPSGKVILSPSGIPRMLVSA